MSLNVLIFGKCRFFIFSHVECTTTKEDGRAVKIRMLYGKKSCFTMRKRHDSIHG